MDNENMTLDAAVAWIEKAQRLGFYNPNTARLIRAGAEAINRVLGPDDDRSVDAILGDTEGIYNRLINLSDSISAETAATYVARTKRLLNDYKAWKSNPKGFRPTAKRGRGPGRAKAAPVATPPAATMSLFPEAAPSAPVGAAGPGYQEHALSLPSGKAYLRIPATISQEDFDLLSAVLKLHVSKATST